MKRIGTTVAALCLVLVVAGAAGAQIVSGETVGATTEEIIARMHDLEAAVDGMPDDAGLRIELGNVYYESNMYEQAEVQYLAVTEMDSTHAGAHLNLGTLYTDMGKI